MCGTVGEPLAATIASVGPSGFVNLEVLDSNGLSATRGGIRLYQGIGNQNETFGVHGRFCEFPEWFQRLKVVG